MTSSTQASQIDDIFQALKSKNSHVRALAAGDLRRYVSTAVSELPPDAADKLWDENINRRLFELTHSQNGAEAFGGLVAISHLLGVEGEENIDSKRNLFRFWNYAKHLLPNHDINLMLAASKTLGQIAEIAGAAFGDRFMEKEIPAAIELIQSDKPEAPKYAGLLILKELARNSPTQVYAHISIVFDNILAPLRDQHVIVREGAAELLAACLEIVTRGERQAHSPYLLKTFQDAQMGLKQSQPEIIHGSLLTFRALLLHAGMFMRATFSDTANQILRPKSHRDLLVRKTVITIIPSLAAYDTQTFTEHFLHKAMAHLLTQLERPNERDFAFVAIGQTASAVGGEMKPFLEPIMLHVKQGLQGKGKNAHLESTFQCIAMLAAAVGPHLTKLLHDQLDLILACGLSDSLRHALVAIAQHVPPLLQTIQDRLLNLLSVILSGQPYKTLGAPRTERARIDHGTNVAQAITHENSPELIVLALSTLGSFDFTGHVLDEYVRSCALPYLEDDNPDIRRAAALTCCRLLDHDPIGYQDSTHAVETISDILNKLLAAGIADPDPTVRHTVLSSLHEGFDRHLAQAENVRSLFFALNDEDFENRVTAIGLIGRIANRNPAHVMPSLRKTLIQLLTELEYSTTLRNKEECTRLLMLLVRATQRLVKPYAISMLQVLLPKANDANPTVAANILRCLGELTSVSGDDATPYIPELMQVIISQLSDSSATKRNAALHILGQVCSSTGYVISPLVEHPQLQELLARILRTETKQSVRREVIKVLGIIGALDPYRRKIRTDTAVGETALVAVNQVPLSQNSGPAASDDYFQTVVVTALLDMLKDQSLNHHHPTVVGAIMSIFKTQGLKCVTFLPQIIPAFSAVTRGPTLWLSFYLEQLAILVGIVEQHVRSFVSDIFTMITELWKTVTLQLPIVTLIEALGKVLEAEFRPFLSTALPLVLQAFDGELTDKKITTQMKILDAFLTLGTNIEEYLHLVIPCIVRTYERPDGIGITPLRKRALQTIGGLSKRINISDHASRITHSLVRVLESSSNELRMTVMDTLCSLVIQLGYDFTIFLPTIKKCIVQNQISHTSYDVLISKLLNGERLHDVAGPWDILQNETKKIPELTVTSEPAKLTVNQQHLKQAWDTSQVTTHEDWLKWTHRLSVAFTTESPSHALRACMVLVDIHPPLAKELFNPAFLSCWTDLYDMYREDLVRSIEVALNSTTVPSELMHRLLGLAEFMEREEKPLPIEHRTLGDFAMRYMAYAKALHYKELEYFSESSSAVIESLVSIQTRLQQHDAASGTLLIAHERYDVTKKEEWYERLGRWQDALGAYERKAGIDPDDPIVHIGKMKCLHALGEWERLAAQVQRTWTNASHDYRQEMAPMAAAAAWSLNEWDLMHDSIDIMKPDSPDRPFYRAILAVHQNQFPNALIQISKARDLLDPELSSFVGEGYGRLYNVIVRAQVLSELEEVILYKQYADQPERQQTIRHTWMKRLRGCQADVEVWRSILQVKTLVLGPETGSKMWIKFANLCRKSGHIDLAEKTLKSLLSPEQVIHHHGSVHTMKAPPNIIYAQLKFMWAAGAKDESLEYLRHFAMNLSRDLNGDRSANADLPKWKLTELSNLLARCYFRIGEWQVEITDSWETRNVDDILHSYYLATHFDTTWYKAWHTWALTNFDVISHMEVRNFRSASRGLGSRIAAHVVQAVDGFFHLISLRKEGALQDTLRLLTLWFKYGSVDKVSYAMGNGFSTVDVDTWLVVIPQIIARIQMPHPNIRRNINKLLVEVGRNHPQALIYPLTVASKSSSISRKNAALVIMERMREHSPTLVQQALLVSRELIRVAILWHELWYDGLEEASQQFFSEKNPDGMIAALEPLHDMVQAGPTTAHEVSFIQVFGRNLHEAQEATRRWRTHGDTSELDRAWNIYYDVYKKVEKQKQTVTTLDLQHVSPRLLKSRDLELAVPGTYQSGKPIVKISSFAAKLTVVNSKQHPRRFSLRGSDGRDYRYLLKGHEDLRQDERVMQLFGLVNTLLSVETESFKRRLHIQRYPAIPLAPNAGLIGLVQDIDTLHDLISDYRNSRRVLVNIEYRLMLQMAPDYNNLTLLQKMEVFEYALENTTGQDLYRVLWLKSNDSEHWLERRTTYTRSLAVNSMVGHILGLGDRHPSNILFERRTGKIVHIDFGDCFEVAMYRKSFPEKIPFRLTRMLTNAMEVSGIEGGFRKTCEITMHVLRANKESLMAVLEAFVYDPLINWRLMEPETNSKRVEADNHVGTDRAADPTRDSAHPPAPTRKPKADEKTIFNDAEEHPEVQEVRNERALFVYNRVQHKLTGREFNPDDALSVVAQVDKLIEQATNRENLCQCFSGWCAFW